MTRRDGRGPFYGWLIVLVGFVTLVLVMGSQFTFGVFYISILISFYLIMALMLASIVSMWSAAPRND